MAGFWYSTRQVGEHRGAALLARCRRTRGRLANQVVKRWRANGGSSRSLDTPVAFSMTLRTSEPGLAATALARGAARLAELAEQVGASHHVGGELVALADLPLAWRVAPARSISRGKSSAHSLCPGDVGAVDVAELALEALVDDLVLLGAGEPAGVLVVVAVDQLEQRRERGAELEAQPAAVAQVVHAGELLPEVGVVEVLGVVGVVGGRHIQLVTARATDTVLAELTR